MNKCYAYIYIKDKHVLLIVHSTLVWDSERLAARSPSLRGSRVWSLRHHCLVKPTEAWFGLVPEWFTIPYLNVKNNNPQDKIIHYIKNLEHVEQEIGVAPLTFEGVEEDALGLCMSITLITITLLLLLLLLCQSRNGCSKQDWTLNQNWHKI